jgi:tRNA-splicing ligase RtcB
VRLLRSGLSRQDIQGQIREIVEALFRNIPSGVGSHRKDFKLSPRDQEKVLQQGAGWAVQQGYGTAKDLEHIEEGGCLEGARPDLVSNKALERGKDQLGTLGSGNHFVEVGYVETIYEPAAARALGLFEGQVTVMVHTGSRGLGHQVCDDSIKQLIRATARYGIELPDRQLCCAPINSPEGQDYLGAMAAAANFAFANRQIITHWVQETLERVLKRGPKDLRLELIYDLCHNIAKFEEHRVEGKMKRLCVHRKGATRAFPPGHPQVPPDYRELGQPVLIPGDMGRYSYVLLGTAQAYAETFGSTCHGAGRIMSRQAAKKAARGHAVIRELEDRGIIVRGAGLGTVVEEISEAYKDVAQVVEVVHQAGISRKVARLRPMGVIKG